MGSFIIWKGKKKYKGDGREYVSKEKENRCRRSGWG